MEKSKKLIDLYLLVLFLLGAISLILRTIACCIEWNDITKHFNDDAVITIANILAVASIGLFATYPLLVKNNEKIASSDTPHSYIPAGMLAVALLFSSFEKLAERKRYSCCACACHLPAWRCVSSIFLPDCVRREKRKRLESYIWNDTRRILCDIRSISLLR